ncbi:SDR family oxidoreductase [Streptomyces sp. NPDC045251]|uniref:SDR family oxidoreductase n=1 Tax=unclassified Streptomyces TaxID=2593676 RepID=UPI0033D82E30
MSARFGSLNLLFLNAGIFRPATGCRGDGGIVRRARRPQLQGPVLHLQKVLPLMNDGGSVVLTVGIESRRGTPGATVGAATYGALLAMLPSLAPEPAPRRIRVNAVSLAATDTPLLNKRGVPESGRDAMRSKIPFERFGSSQEVAEAFAFLASDTAGYITGQDTTVAGGYGLSA